MARYIRSQDEIRVCIDEDGDLVLTQMANDDEYTIYVNFQNIENFIEVITWAVKDGCDGAKNEMV